MNEAAQNVVQQLTPSAVGSYQNFPLFSQSHLKQAFLAGVRWAEQQAKEKKDEVTLEEAD